MSRANKEYYGYLWYFIGTFLALITATTAINYLVDPYGLYDARRIPGINLHKPAADTHVRLAKPYQVKAVMPRTVIVGNSRPEVGMNPSNNCWPDQMRPVFNFGLPGAGIYMQARHAQHAIYVANVKHMLWGVDFIDFIKVRTGPVNKPQWPPEAEGFESRLAVNADGTRNSAHERQSLKDFLRNLVSLDALSDSIKTLMVQNNDLVSTIRRDGFNPASKYLDIIAVEGQGLVFRQKNEAVTDLFSRPGLQLFDDGMMWSEEFEVVRGLLEYASQNNVNVVLFINPYHADYLLAIDLLGLWDQFVSWKVHLTTLAEQFGVELWDYSGINSQSAEKPPPLQDRETVLEWFWEPAHYREKYGSQILGQILNHQCNSADNPARGKLLTSENIMEHLRSGNNELEKYKSNNPDVLQRLPAWDQK